MQYANQTVTDHGSPLVSRLLARRRSERDRAVQMRNLVRAIEPRSRGLVFLRPAVLRLVDGVSHGLPGPFQFNGLTSLKRMSYGAPLLSHYTSPATEAREKFATTSLRLLTGFTALVEAMSPRMATRRAQNAWSASERHAPLDPKAHDLHRLHPRKDTLFPKSIATVHG